MTHQLAAIAVVVRDYDEAVGFYVGKLGFALTEDTDMGQGKRWVVVTPQGSTCRILLAKAKNEAELAAVGHQTGGRVFLFLHTDDFRRDYQRWQEQGVHFTETPRDESYGMVVVFEDLYGNKWDLIQPK
ncbi:MAG: VOC family protein [Saprospiraceae bacterium]